MGKGKRNRQHRSTPIDALEAKLNELSNLRMHHADRVKALDTKIAAQEGLIEIAKEEAGD